MEPSSKANGARGNSVNDLGRQGRGGDTRQDPVKQIMNKY